MKIIRKLCRWVLKDEIASYIGIIEAGNQLAFRLSERLEPYAPLIETNGECQKDNIDFRLDLAMGLNEPVRFPVGEIKIDSPVMIGKRNNH